LIYYVLSAKNTLEIMSKMQENNLENSYFCEDMFSHFDRINAPKEAKQETVKDLISVVDGIIVVGSITDNMAYVLDFADEINMEVEYLEDAE
jgi:4-hydroxy-3-methylbut-2-enyl diphosphate reductase IspH